MVVTHEQKVAALCEQIAEAANRTTPPVFGAYDMALELAKAGVRATGMPPLKKYPTSGWGGASTNIHHIQRQLRNSGSPHNDNVALVPRLDFAVVDLDVGPDAWLSHLTERPMLADWLYFVMSETPAPMHVTGSGGMHVFVRRPEHIVETKLQFAARANQPEFANIDYLVGRRLVVIPPSITISKHDGTPHQYRALRADYASPEAFLLALHECVRTPRRLVDALTQVSHHRERLTPASVGQQALSFGSAEQTSDSVAQREIENGIDKLRNAEIGRRRKTLFAQACFLFRFVLAERANSQYLQDLLLKTALHIGLERRESIKAIEGGMQKAVESGPLRFDPTKAPRTDASLLEEVAAGRIFSALAHGPQAPRLYRLQTDGTMRLLQTKQAQFLRNTHAVRARRAIDPLENPEFVPQELTERGQEHLTSLRSHNVGGQSIAEIAHY